MPEGFGRVLGARANRLTQGCGNLMGLAAGLVADQVLNDSEIRFLDKWLESHIDVATTWPGDILYDRVKAVLADGVITEAERAHLLETLNEICGGTLQQAIEGPVNQLAFDSVAAIDYPGSVFCVTGDFVFGPRERVQHMIIERGGGISKGITRNLNYLVVGLRGSNEWKHGSYGTKIEKAIEYKRAGLKLFIVREDIWSQSLKAA